jgi:uncharacterized protein (DUF58 family)
MAGTPLNAALPSEAALASFARVATPLLVAPHGGGSGARAGTRRAGIGLETLDHRDYRHGDALRHVDWRASARRAQPVVRRFEAESATDWTLLLDLSSSMAGAKALAARSAAMALAHALLHVGHRVGLLAFGERVRHATAPGRGPLHRAALARALAALPVRPDGERTLPGACAPHLPPGGSAFVLSDFLADDALRDALARLRSRCTALHALMLVDAADVQLPPGGAGELLELRDAESGQPLTVRREPASEAEAARRHAALGLRAAAAAASLDAAFSRWPVAEPWQRALLRHLQAARGRR